MLPQWWGCSAIFGSKMAWGTRAIFKPSLPYPLEFIWDRQSYEYKGIEKSKYYEFLDYINEKVIPTVQKLSVYYNSESKDKLVWHFEWPFDTNLLLVVQGEPSQGYFDLSVSLVGRKNVPAIIYPPGYRGEENKVAVLTEPSVEEIAQQQDAYKEYVKQQGDLTRLKKEENAKKLGNGPMKSPGEPLAKGDRIIVVTNNVERHAVVLSVVKGEALVQFFTPNGYSFYRIVSAITQSKIRGVSERKIPKRFGIDNCVLTG
jgi:hypothetical protein